MCQLFNPVYRFTIRIINSLINNIILVCLQSPPYSSGSYDLVKTELSRSAEDLTSSRAQIIDDDDDDHDDHDDNDRINDAEGMDPERLKAFNVSIQSN